MKAFCHEKKNNSSRVAHYGRAHIKVKKASIIGHVKIGESTISEFKDAAISLCLSRVIVAF